MITRFANENTIAAIFVPYVAIAAVTSVRGRLDSFEPSDLACWRVGKVLRSIAQRC